MPADFQGDELTPSKERVLIKLLGMFERLVGSVMDLTTDTDDELRKKLGLYWSCSLLLVGIMALYSWSSFELPKLEYFELINGWVKLPDLASLSLLLGAILLFLLTYGAVCAVIATGVRITIALPRAWQWIKNRRAPGPSESQRQAVELEQRRERAHQTFDEDTAALNSAIMKEKLRKEEGERIWRVYKAELADIDRCRELLGTPAEPALPQQTTPEPDQQVELDFGDENP